jgi:aspartate kinase
MIVCKFGGTSVRDGEWIDRALSVTERQLRRAPVLVASAMGDTTDVLEEVAAAAENGDAPATQLLLGRLHDHHTATASGFLSGENRVGALTRIGTLFEELSSLVQGVSLIRECSPRTRDAILSFGELLSTTIIHYRAVERGIESTLLDSRSLIRTDSHFTNATPDLAATNEAVRKLVRPREGALLVAQGFIASTSQGVTSTLGRGGSDFTASLIGAALGVEEVQIWTDVSGIMSADPRVIPEARTIPELRYDEAAELAFFGAKVVHPYTILPAIEHGIPVLVKNTGIPNEAGTEIRADTPQRGIRAIASKAGITLVTISSSRMINAYGFLKDIFAVFDTHRVSVDLVATSEVSVTSTVDSGSDVRRVVQDLAEYGSVTVEGEKAIVSLVGQDLWKESSFIARVFDALRGVPVRLISLGSSDTNLSLVVPDDRAHEAVRALHREFF